MLKTKEYDPKKGPTSFAVNGVYSYKNYKGESVEPNSSKDNIKKCVQHIAKKCNLVCNLYHGNIEPSVCYANWSREYHPILGPSFSAYHFWNEDYSNWVNDLLLVEDSNWMSILERVVFVLVDDVVVGHELTPWDDYDQGHHMQWMTLWRNPGDQPNLMAFHKKVSSFPSWKFLSSGQKLYFLFSVYFNESQPDIVRSGYGTNRGQAVYGHTSIGVYPKNLLSQGALPPSQNKDRDKKNYKMIGNDVSILDFSDKKERDAFDRALTNGKQQGWSSTFFASQQNQAKSMVDLNDQLVQRYLNFLEIKS